MKVCVVLGSSNLTGCTYSLVKQTFKTFHTIPLAEKKIAYFDYQNRYENDEFIDCINEMLQYDLIVLASPVYWYSISAQLKIFLDRLTDLLFFDKTKLIELRKKKFAYMSIYSNDAGYALDIIRKTCNYLKFDLIGELILQIDDINIANTAPFYELCKQKMKSFELNSNIEAKAD